jgi:aminocarboxymuconate-semialdehyde decarboxylase
VNDEIAGMTRERPARFAGLATLPMQDVKSAIDELERAVTKLGLKGAELDTEVNGEQWDEAKFLPFFKAAEAMGAVLFFHPQPQNNFLAERINRYGLANSMGVILDDAIVTAVLICGGVLEACPNIRICMPTAVGRVLRDGPADRAWHGRPETRRIPSRERINASTRHGDRQRSGAAVPADGWCRPCGPRQRLLVPFTLALGLGAKMHD